jgi:hypothetical protein
MLRTLSAGVGECRQGAEIQFVVEVNSKLTRVLFICDFCVLPL